MTRSLIYAMVQQRSFLIGPKRHCNRRHNTRLALLAPSSSLRFSTSSSQSPSASKPTSSWERSAKLVKNTDVTNPYLDQVRSEVVDPHLQLKTIEDELCGAIGKALGRQGEKVLVAIREMKEERARYVEYIQDSSFEEALQTAQRYNASRERAMKARWELLVHRQAVGFTVDNHSVVHSTFPIGQALPVKLEEIRALDPPSDGGNSKQRSADGPSSAEQPAKSAWGDQLSWWQRVGRWK